MHMPSQRSAPRPWQFSLPAAAIGFNCAIFLNEVIDLNFAVAAILVFAGDINNKAKKGSGTATDN